MSSLRSIEATIPRCQRCKRLREHCAKVAKEKKRQYQEWDYWGKPVPGWGDPAARLWILGLAPAAHGANRTGRMFTGDSSGNWLYRAMHRAGFGTQAESVSRNDGLKLIGAYISSAGRCAPPQNKPTKEELTNCAPYLDGEYHALKERKVIMVLGNIALGACLELLKRQGKTIPRPRPKFGHNKLIEIDGVKILMSYHPSRQNTNTGTLTLPMWNAVFDHARKLVG